MRRFIYGLVLISMIIVTNSAQAFTQGEGSYIFDEWSGAPLKIYYNIPTKAKKDAPVLMVIAGAKRNADIYCGYWKELSDKHGFITLCPSAAKEDYPDEYDYNAGSVITAEGKRQAEEKWLFSALEKIFEGFKKDYGSSVKEFSLFGHSAGGGFVHRYMLLKPDAPVFKAVAANPAFTTMPNFDHAYPFGLKKIGLEERDLSTWLSQPLTIMLGELDTGPRGYPLSNSKIANAQGPSVYARGLNFFSKSLVSAKKYDVSHRWKLVVIPMVGHSGSKMSPAALEHLF